MKRMGSIVYKACSKTAASVAASEPPLLARPSFPDQIGKVKTWRIAAWAFIATACAQSATSGVIHSGTLRLRPTTQSVASDIAVIRGDLRIEGDGAVALPRLREVTGDLYIGGRFSSLDLPALRQIGGSI